MVFAGVPAAIHHQLEFVSGKRSSRQGQPGGRIVSDMSNDRWKARAKGGRRGILKVALLGAVEWTAVGLRNTALTVLLMRVWNAITARREQARATRHYVLKTETGHFRVITGTANMQLGPMTVYAVGTVPNLPAPDDQSSQIA
jgi:hypothetical protein